MVVLINREIENEENLYCFQVGFESDLTAQMKMFLKKDIRRPMKHELIQRGEKRKQLMGERLIEAIRYVSEHSAPD